jgi:hypothetical protein
MFTKSKQIAGMFNPFLVAMYVGFVLVFVKTTAAIMNIVDYTNREHIQAQN